MNILPAGPEHFHAVVQLLRDAKLVHADLTPDLRGFLVITDAAGIVAAGGLERLDGEAGALGLVRSLVVAPAHRGRGYGRQLYERLEATARGAGIGELFLLTETAPDFFERHGYRVLERDRAPAAVRATAQFRELCPAGATFMHKPL